MSFSVKKLSGASLVHVPASHAREASARTMKRRVVQVPDAYYIDPGSLADSIVHRKTLSKNMCTRHH